MAAPTFINSSNSSSTTTSTSLSITIPTNLEDDLIYVRISTTASSTDPAASISPPDGNWTEEYDENISTTSAVRHYVAWRIAPSGGLSSPQSFSASAAAAFAAIAIVLRGVDTADPIDVKSTFNSGTGTNPSSLAVITSANDTFVIRDLTIDDDDAINTYPETSNNLTNSIATPGNGTRMGFCNKTQASPGDTGAGTWALSASEEWGATTVAVQPPQGPSISNAEDEDFLDNETDIDVAGSNFGASQTGSADIEIGDNAVYGSCVDIESQVVNSWSDTNINIDIEFGTSSLEYGYNWLYVTDSGGTTSGSYQINLYEILQITGTDQSGDQFRSGDSVKLQGSSFGNSQDSGELVQLGDQSDGGGTMVDQTVTNWTDTEITFTAVQGALNPDDNIYLFVKIWSKIRVI